MFINQLLDLAFTINICVNIRYFGVIANLSEYNYSLTTCEFLDNKSTLVRDLEVKVSLLNLYNFMLF